MTEVEFHTGVQDPVAFACRLLRKASRLGVRVLVTAPERHLAALDRALWTFDERDFVAHVRQPGATHTVGRLTPIWLAAELAQANLPGAPKVLLNLGASAPTDLAVLDRLIEVLSTEPEAVEVGRARWRHYKTLGLSVVHHPHRVAND